MRARLRSTEVFHFRLSVATAELLRLDIRLSMPSEFNALISLNCQLTTRAQRNLNTITTREKILGIRIPERQVWSDNKVEKFTTRPPQIFSIPRNSLLNSIGSGIVNTPEIKADVTLPPSIGDERENTPRGSNIASKHTRNPRRQFRERNRIFRDTTCRSRDIPKRRCT